MSDSAAKGAWDYSNVVAPTPYGDTKSYKSAARHFNFPTAINVEDWGCGTGWMRQYVAGYRGIDGSPSIFADAVVDLAKYMTTTPGLFMRHVLEHNPDTWREILTNAVCSFEQRMVLVIFTPFVKTTGILRPKGGAGVLGAAPDMAFNREELLGFFDRYIEREVVLETATQYGIEHLFFLVKP